MTENVVIHVLFPLICDPSSACNIFSFEGLMPNLHFVYGWLREKNASLL